MPKFTIESFVTVKTLEIVEASDAESAADLVRSATLPPMKQEVVDHEITQIHEVESFDQTIVDAFNVSDPRYIAQIEKEFVLTSDRN